MVWNIFTICSHLVFGYFWVHVPISQTTSQTTSVAQSNLLDPKSTPVQQIWPNCPHHTLYTLLGFYLYTFQILFLPYMGVLPAYMSLISCMPGASGGKKRASDPLELELDSCELPCGC